jgi:hypothetical protein
MAFWTTLPGFLTAIGGLITAIVTAVALWHGLSSGTGGQPSATGPPPTRVSTPGESSGPTSSPAPANSLDLPTAMVGTWKGTGHHYSPAADFAIIMTLRSGQVGSVIGQIDRPTLGNCHQLLKLDLVRGQSIEATEAYDPANSNANCYGAGALIATEGAKVTASIRGNSLEWTETYPTFQASSPTAVATLTSTP